METIRVLVASQNQIKQQAVESAFRLFTDQVVRVELAPQPIDSGVGEQPLNLVETAKGALQRLAQITDGSGYDYYVSIEGGAYAVDLPSGQQWYESACAAVSSPQLIKPSVAYGPAFPVPPHMAEHLKNGKDLNEIMELEAGIIKAGNGMGFNGWLTDGKLDREAASSQAVLLALYGLKHAND